MNGTVIDTLAGAPVVGATVFVAGQAGIVTDTSGNFTAVGVTGPYDVSVRSPGSNSVRSFRGLTLTDPRLTIMKDGMVPNEATVTGTAVAPTTLADDSLTCVASGPGGLIGFGSAWSAGTSPIAWSMVAGGSTLPVTWYGASSAQASLHCMLERSSGGSLTDAFYGSKSLTVAAGGSFADQQVTLSSIGIAAVSGSIIDPTGASLTLTVGPSYPGGRGYYNAVTASGSFSVGVPLVPGGMIRVGARHGSTRVSSTVVPAASTVTQDVTMLAAPAVTSPMASQVNVATTSAVTWSGGAGHVFIVSISFTGGIVEVVTAGSSVVLPDLVPMGLAYPPGGTANVRVIEYGLVGSADAVATGSVLHDIAHSAGDFQYAASPVVSFTFAN